MNSTALFRYYSRIISELIEDEGILFRAYADPQLPHFTQLSNEEQMVVVENLRLYSEICSRVRAQNGSLNDNRLMVIIALEILGMTVAPEDLALIDNAPDLMVEMYSLNHVQLFRTFNLLETTTYTFEDLCCRKWYHLYERAPGEHEKMVEKVMEFYGQKHPVRMAPGLGTNVIKEKATLEKLLCIAEMEWLIPLWKKGVFAGAMTLIRNKNPELAKS
ncbi:hypothetical protein ACLSU7_07575 [Bdellovibrio sp. HCB185ZH]|uniref:hypothetical protein n=1 Tax=Bdellovibrio sp. HCB185ZH TaxID=3394235 RepID=UPI0039A69106